MNNVCVYECVKYNDSSFESEVLIFVLLRCISG